MTGPGPVIVEATGVTKTFTTPDGRALPVLDGVSLTLREGEIVALLGKSGSGKSTMLRCIAGLIAPSAGSVSYRGTLLNGANPGVAMVFQSFALLPWLTVQQNVELAMEAREVPSDVRRDRALRAIDLIGLDGFESASWSCPPTPGASAPSCPTSCPGPATGTKQGSSSSWTRCTAS